MSNRNELIVAHLEQIQNQVARMAKNSFSLKEWGVIIVSALLALDASRINSNLAYIAYLPALVFWILDGYFLSQERYFRRLYDAVRMQLVSGEDSKIEPFSMDAPRFAHAGDHWFPATFSKTLVIFHGMIIILITVLTLTF